MKYVLQCENVYDEALRVANAICGLVAGGARWQDIAVVICDYDESKSIYIEAFADCGIPVNVDVGAKLIEFAITKYLRDIMDARHWVGISFPQKDDKVSNLCKNLKKMMSEALEVLFDEIAFGKINSILDTIQNILGQQIITVREFNNMFCTLAAACKLSDVPRFLDRVLLVSAGEYEPSSIPYLFITGANDGNFPPKVSDTDIITEQDINDMAIRIEPSASLQSHRAWRHAANIIESAKEIYISYSATNISGEHVNPSPLIKGGIILTSDGINTKKFAAQKVLAAIGNKTAFVNSEAADYFASVRYAAELKDFKIPVLDVNSRELECGRNLFLSNNSASVTQIENFVKCQYYHFLQNGLKLKKKDPIDEISPAIVGTILHRILQRVLGENTTTIDKIVDESTDGFKLPKTTRLLIKKQVRVLVNFLLDDMKDGGYRPVYFEHKLEKQIDGVTVRGIADRIDIDKDGKYIVVDYKSGSSAPPRLQIPFYMSCLENAGGGYYFGLKSLKKKNIDISEVAPALEKTSEAIKNINNGTIKPNPINETVCKFCPAGAMCGGRQ